MTGLIELAGALADAGQVAKGLATVEAAIEQSEVGWHTLELLRLKGELLLSQEKFTVVETAEDLFRQALDGAREQGSLSWELRAATSLARLLRSQGRPATPPASSPSTIASRRVSGTADLIAAKQLLDDLGAPDRD